MPRRRCATSQSNSLFTASRFHERFFQQWQRFCSILTKENPDGHAAPHPYANAARDLLIIEAIGFYRKKFGWHATRSEGTDSQSACAEVALMFGMKERAVEEVWSKRRKHGR